MKNKETPVFHPFLFAIFPILFLYSHNIRTVDFQQIIFPLLIALLLACFMLFFLFFLLKDKIRAGLITSLFFLLFFSFGHFSGLIKNLKWHIGHYYMLIFFLWVLLFLVGIYFFIKKPGHFNDLTKALNFVAASLVVISLINIVYYKRTTKFFFREKNDAYNNFTENHNFKKIKGLPNIYYIILDSYGRLDFLKEEFDYDNTDFIDFLSKKGFYVANKSTSNYSRTISSLSSSLNMMYLDALVKKDNVSIQSVDDVYLSKKFKCNSVFKILKNYGYKIIGFQTNYHHTELTNADIYIKYSGFIDDFTTELLMTTPIPHILNKLKIFTLDDIQRKIILSAFDNFDKVTNLPREKEPFFVFAHIICPHPPFVFDENGNKPDQKLISGFGEKFEREEYIKKYIQQLIFINIKTKGAVENILENSKTPPIIIIQGDHGPGRDIPFLDSTDKKLRSDFDILNAYYFPNFDYNNLYDNISPVNTFRIILKNYFNRDYPLISDESYFFKNSKFIGAREFFEAKESKR